MNMSDLCEDSEHDWKLIREEASSFSSYYTKHSFSGVNRIYECKKCGVETSEV